MGIGISQAVELAPIGRTLMRSPVFGFCRRRRLATDRYHVWPNL